MNRDDSSPNIAEKLSPTVLHNLRQAISDALANLDDKRVVWVIYGKAATLETDAIADENGKPNCYVKRVIN